MQRRKWNSQRSTGKCTDCLVMRARRTSCSWSQFIPLVLLKNKGPLSHITDQSTSKRETRAVPTRLLCWSSCHSSEVPEVLHQKSTQHLPNNIRLLERGPCWNPSGWSTCQHRLTLIVPGSMSSIFRRRDSTGFTAEASVCQTGRERFFFHTHYKRLSGSTSKGEAACVHRSAECVTAFHGQI